MILDTNALSAWADGDAAVETPLTMADRLAVPVVVLGEFWFGVRQSRHRRAYEDWLARRLPSAEILPIGSATAHHYADIRFEMKRSGRRIPANDLWIAALTRQHGLPLLSRDSDFDAVPELERIPF